MKRIAIMIVIAMYAIGFIGMLVFLIKGSNGML